MQNQIMKKINVIGTSGSGKTTFAKKLSEKLDYPYIEMDAIFWGKDWYWPGDEEFFENLKKHLNVNKWVLDGNYNRTVPIKWKEVDTIIWIDYSFHRTIFQALKRAITRIITKKELWAGTGNKETFRKLFSKESIILWTLQTYHKNKEQYSTFSQNTKFKDIEIVRFTSPAECKNYLRKV
jgi:adenylate kinase family enzyme